jgi:FkbM family methyltransferase
MSIKITEQYSKDIGNHYLLKNEKSKSAFKNPMGVLKKLPLFKDDIVADIGSYVGEYSLYAAPRCKRVKSYEASPRTFEVLKMNRMENMEIFNAAVVGDDSEFVELFLGNGVGVTNTIIKKKMKKDSISVPAIKYEQAVAGCSVVKIDVEGAEYDYNIIQPHLRAIILEFHPVCCFDWKAKSAEMIEKLNSEFKAIHVPGFKNGWDFNGCWVRK